VFPILSFVLSTSASHSYPSFLLLLAIVFRMFSTLDQHVNMLSPRNHDKLHPHSYVNPEVPLNLGLWFLYAGATVFLALRVWIKVTRRHGLWWDDWLLLVTWVCMAITELYNDD
jgi:hypothetical protein